MAEAPARSARCRSRSSASPSVSYASTLPESSSPAARSRVFPPAPAHRSRMCWPGRASTRAPTSWLPSSWTSKSPSWWARRPRTLGRPSRWSASGAYRAGWLGTPSAWSRSASASRSRRSRLARMVTGPGRLQAAAKRGASGPRARSSSGTSASGQENRVGQSSGGGRGSGSSMPVQWRTDSFGRCARSRSNAASSAAGESEPAWWARRRRQRATPKRASEASARWCASQPGCERSRTVSWRAASAPCRTGPSASTTWRRTSGSSDQSSWASRSLAARSSAGSEGAFGPVGVRSVTAAVPEQCPTRGGHGHHVLRAGPQCRTL